MLVEDCEDAVENMVSTDVVQNLFKSTQSSQKIKKPS